MKQFDYKYIKSLDPCYDPIRFIPKDWTGNALDILKLEGPSVEDKFFVVLREGLISDKTLRLFAVWAYRQTLEFVKDPDPRSLKAAEVAEAYALGKATDEELKSARLDAYSAYFTAYSASVAAYSAYAYAATARSKQLNKLIEMLEKENKEYEY